MRAMTALIVLLLHGVAFAGDSVKTTRIHAETLFRELSEWSYWYNSASLTLTEIIKTGIEDHDEIEIDREVWLEAQRDIARWRAEKARPLQERVARRTRAAIVRAFTPVHWFVERNGRVYIENRLDFGWAWRWYMKSFDFDDIVD